jgi:hypothetical protein
MKLERWFVVSKSGITVGPSERDPVCLYGVVHGHPLHIDGKEVRTSRLVASDGDCVVTRSGSAYELGEPHPLYEADYPNSKRRLLASLETLAEIERIQTWMLPAFAGTAI